MPLKIPENRQPTQHNIYFEILNNLSRLLSWWKLQSARVLALSLAPRIPRATGEGARTRLTQNGLWVHGSPEPWPLRWIGPELVHNRLERGGDRVALHAADVHYLHPGCPRRLHAGLTVLVFARREDGRAVQHQTCKCMGGSCGESCMGESMGGKLW